LKREAYKFSFVLASAALELPRESLAVKNAVSSIVAEGRVEKSGAPRPDPELVLNWAAAQYEIALKGHDFSRAKKNRIMCPGFSP
jgi:hypothetical protein